MNILVTGSEGQLGRALRRASAASSDRYFFTDVAGNDTLRLDITDAEAVDGFIREHGIGVVVNCAAYTNVDRAEDDAARAELLNATAVGYLADAMQKSGGVLMHISTDYVFGGTAGNTAALRTPSGQFITGEGINIRLTNRRIHIIPEGADRKGKCPRYIPCREADRLLVFVRNGFQHLSVDRFDIITQCSIHAPLHHPAKR